MKNGDQIKDLLKDFQPKHSDFQIKYFIVGKAGDNWARYKQALREIQTRVTALEGLKEDRQILQISSKPRWPALTRRARIIRKIKTARKARQMAAVDIEIRHTERELDELVDLAAALKKHFGEIDFLKRKALEENSWRNKARQMAAVDMFLNHGQLSEKSMEMILSLPPEIRGGIMVDLKQNGPERYLEN